jgi:hypothetical protein
VTTRHDRPPGDRRIMIPSAPLARAAKIPIHDDRLTANRSALGLGGPVGPKGDAGPSGLTWRGTWQPTDSYAVNDVVEHQGSAFVAVAASTGLAPPSSDWHLLALSGAVGSMGPQGPKGDVGPRGPAGVDGASVVVSGVPTAHGVCTYGGTAFSVGATTSYACNGAAGISVTAIPLAPGADPVCPAGGTRFTTGTTVTYACNSSPDGPCPVGQMLCGSSCVDLQSDEANCGACSNTCDSRTCVSGRCAKVAFVTAQGFTGNLGGVAGANLKCQTAASAAGLHGQYRAWISDSAGNSPGASFKRSLGPYVQVNGAIVAADWSGLLAPSGGGRLAQGLWLDERGNSAQYFPWTATSTTGFYSTGSNCFDWSSTSGYGGAGSHGSPDFQWTSSQGRDCNTLQSLYCFEQ